MRNKKNFFLNLDFIISFQNIIAGQMEKSRKKIEEIIKLVDREITVFSKTKYPFSFKPFLLGQGLIVFAVILFSVFSFTKFFQPQPQVSESQIIKNFTVKQTSAIIAGQPTKWTMIVNRNQIREGQNLLSLPKEAKNIKVKTITKAEAEILLAKDVSQNSVQLTTKERKKLASTSSHSSFFVASILSKVSKFFLASAENAIDNIVETITEEVIVTEDAKLVDLSEEATSPTSEVDEKTSEVITEKQEQKEEEKEEETEEVIQSEEITEPETIAVSETAILEVEETVSPSDQEITATSDVAQTVAEVVEEEPVEEEPVEEEEVIVEKEFVKVDYEISAVEIKEEKTKKGKLVTVSDTDKDPEKIKLKDVLTFAVIPEILKVGDKDKIKIQWKNNGDEEMEFNAFDLDKDGMLDYVEWIVPHLSDQIFEIIFISKAFKLDENWEIIEDIYDQVYTQDNIWTTVEDGQYVRVTFEKILDNTKDITLYAKPTNIEFPVIIEVYTENGTVPIVAFENIDQENVYKVYLTGLQDPTDVFDLKVIGGSVDLDYIVDPEIVWDGGGTDETCGGGVGDGNKWACVYNWSTDTLPGTADVATFNATSTKAATIATSISVSGIAINSGYTGGVITQSSGATITVGAGNFVQADGTFSGGDSTIDINGTYSLSAGIFTSTSGTLSVSSTFTISGSPTFTHNSGTVQFDASAATVTPSTVTFNNVSFTSAVNKTIANSQTLTVIGTLALTDGAIIQTTIPDGGSVSAQGNIIQANTFDGGTSLLILNGTGAQTYTINGGIAPKVTFNNANLNVTPLADCTFNSLILTAGVYNGSSVNTTIYSNNAGAYRDFKVNGGTFNADTGTVSFTGYSTNVDADGQIFNNLTVNSSTYNIVIATGTSITVNGTLILNNGIVNTGTINAKGNVTQASGFDGGTATLILNGTGAQTYTINGGIAPKVTFNNANLNVTPLADCTFNSLILTAGVYNGSSVNTTVDSGSAGSTIDFKVNGGTFNADTGTVSFTGYSMNVDADGQIFNNLTINKDSNYLVTIATGTSITVNGTLILNNGIVNTGTINAKGNVAQESFFDGGTGLVVINGTGDQTFTGSATTATGALTNIEISKTSGTLYLVGTFRTGKNWTYTQGTLDATTNDSTVVFISTITIAGSHTLDNVNFDGSTFTIANSNTLTVGGTLTLNNGSINQTTIPAGGSISAQGAVITQALGFDGSTGLIVINGTGDQTFTGSATTSLGNLLNIEISKTSGTLYLAGTIRADKNWTYTQGTLDATTNDSTVVFAGTLTITGSHTLDNVNFNSGSIFTIANSNTLTVSGTLNLNNGTVNQTTIPADGSVSAQGNVTTISTFDGGTATLVFAGSVTQTFDLTGATGLFNGDIKVNKSGGQVNLASTLTMDAASQDLVIEEGIFDLNNNTLAVSGAGSTFIVENGGNFQLQGGETTTAPTLQSGSKVIYDGTGSTIQDWTYHHLTINGSGTFTLGREETLGGNLIITTGELALSGSTGLNITGSWTNSVGAGGFTANTGTVTFLAGTHTITGANTFYDLTLAANNTVTFPFDATQTIGNTFSCTGRADNLININSSSPGTKATLSKASGTVNCDYLSLTDSAVTGGAAWNAGDNSTAVSNISGWLGFNAAPSIGTGPSDGGSSVTTPTNVGSNTTFTTTATDAESDNYYLAICKTNAITAVNSGAPTCDGGNWCISSTTASDALAICSYTTLINDAENNNWYAFVCDHNSASICSSANQGSGDNSSPFKVNHIPVFSAISTSPDVVGLASEIVFSSTASDPDTDTSADTVTLYVCKANDFTGSACGSAGEWCHSSASASDPSCSYTVQSSDTSGVKTYYGYIVDNHNFQSSSNPLSDTFTINIDAPAISNISPATGGVSSLPSSISFTLSEIGYCRASASDLSYSNMTSANDCSGGGTTSIVCNVSSNGALSISVNISCQDMLGSENTADNNTNIYYNLQSASGGGGGQPFFNPIVETVQETVKETVQKVIEKVEEIPQQISEVPETIEKIIDILKPEPEEVIVFPPIEESVKEETPLVFKYPEENISSSDIGNFVFTPLSKEIQSLIAKFPKLESTFEKLEINKMKNLQEIVATSFNLPTLNELLPQLSQGVPLFEVSNNEKKKIPNNIVFASMAEEKIGLNVKILITDKGDPIQTINATQNQMVTFSVNPEFDAKTVKGYVIFKGKNSSAVKNKDTYGSSFIAGLSATLTQFQVEETKENNGETEFVLDIFDYTDLDKDGIYTATIVAPAVDANYEVRTIVDYKNKNISSKEFSMIMLVDPEGYVYKKINDSEENRIKGAKISLYWLNPETHSPDGSVQAPEYELWPAKNFSQDNPQTTNATGRYSFLVPEGYYYLKVEHPLYAEWQSQPFEVQQGSGIHKNIELTSRNWLLSMFGPGSLLIAISLLLLSIVILVSAILISSSIKRKKIINF